LDLKSLFLLAKQAYKKRGIRYTVRVGFYTLPVLLVFWYIYYKKIKPHNDSFLFQGRNYSYFYGFYNGTWYNERSVEISIVMEAVKKYQGKKILEVGNVLSQYFEVQHDILDKYETRQGIIKEDIADFKSSEKYDLIVSISTLEHVGYDEHPKDDMKISRVMENLKTLLKPDGMIIVTLPLGQNPILDKLLKDSTVKFNEQYYLKRISKGNEWRQANWEDVKDVRYGEPFFAANALVIGIDYGKNSRSVNK
jgi:SAM-dependent methyltransferase